MPEQFLAVTRGGRLPVQSVAHAEPQAVVVPTTPSGSPSQATPPSGATRAVGSRRVFMVWMLVAVIVLIGGGAAAWFVIRSVPRGGSPTVPSATPPAAPAPVVVPPPVPTPPSTPPPAPPVAPPSTPPAAPAADQDTDGDGLTDAEELVLGTDPGLRDTDRDGYDDRTELLNLYNPLAVAPQKLVDSGAVFAYEHPTDGWDIYVPTKWSVAATDQDQLEMRITSGVDGEFIILRMEPNSHHRTLRDWIMYDWPSISEPSAATIASLTTKRQAVGARIGMRYAFFASGDDRIVTMTHVTTAPGFPRFLTLFEMIVQSFRAPAVAR